MASDKVKAETLTKYLMTYFSGQLSTSSESIVIDLALLRLLFYNVKENVTSPVITNFRKIFVDTNIFPVKDLPADVVNHMYDSNLFLSADVGRVIHFLMKERALAYFMSKLEECFDMYENYVKGPSDYKMRIDGILFALSNLIRITTAEEVNHEEILLPYEMRKSIFEGKPLSYKKFFDFIKGATVLQFPELYIFKNLQWHA